MEEPLAIAYYNMYICAHTHKLYNGYYDDDDDDDCSSDGGGGSEIL